MSRFEQAVSKPRYSITQFHRPVELKLKRLQDTNFSHGVWAVRFLLRAMILSDTARR